MLWCSLSAEARWQQYTLRILLYLFIHSNDNDHRQIREELAKRKWKMQNSMRMLALWYDVLDLLKQNCAFTFAM
ncbi:MAG: hypothetical protein IJT36_06770 [Alphaproteobacteria bacterium]|nr:hypothetical protein [Alphaproteobacteria bacterium]